MRFDLGTMERGSGNKGGGSDIGNNAGAGGRRSIGYREIITNGGSIKRSVSAPPIRETLTNAEREGYVRHTSVR